ncbi:hypothetical protein ACJRO7_022243 [Eucalyptus globulus]|uniref:Uncharacterized protein n=1 Tax=Eucalyptus globulus TaxID=34317 RepID=A0ABD3KMK8_EUCGL
MGSLSFEACFLAPELSVETYQACFPAPELSVDRQLACGCTALLVAALRGDWKAGQEFLYGNPSAVRARFTGNLETALHIVAGGGLREFVEEPVKMTMPNDLEMRNKVGNTTLYFAATSGVREIAKAMVDKNPRLPLIRGSNEAMPLCIASLSGKQDMVLYLLCGFETDWSTFQFSSGSDGKRRNGSPCASANALGILE